MSSYQISSIHMCTHAACMRVYMLVKVRVLGLRIKCCARLFSTMGKCHSYLQMNLFAVISTFERLTGS